MAHCEEIFQELVDLWPVDKTELVGLPWFNIPNVRSVSNLFGTGETNAIGVKLAPKDVISTVMTVGKTTGTTYLVDGNISVKCTPKTGINGDIYTIKVSFKSLGYGKEWAEMLYILRKKGSTVAYIGRLSDGSYVVFSPADDTRPQVKDDVVVGQSSSCSVDIEFQNVQGALVVES